MGPCIPLTNVKLQGHWCLMYKSSLVRVKIEYYILFLFQLYTEHPLRGKEFYCNDGETFIDGGGGGDYNFTDLSNISTTMTVPSIMTLTNMSANEVNGTVYSTDNSYSSPIVYSHGDSHGYGHGTDKYNKHFNEPNTALLSTILIFGTFLIAYFLRIFRNSRFLGRSVSVWISFHSCF